VCHGVREDARLGHLYALSFNPKASSTTWPALRIGGIYRAALLSQLTIVGVTVPVNAPPLF
jgi:hypothetical protein